MADLHADMWDCPDEDWGYEPEVLIGVKVLHVTEKAILIEYKNKTAWFPKSICFVDGDCIEFEEWFNPNWEVSQSRTKVKPIEGDYV